MTIQALLAEAQKARLADDYEAAIRLCRAYLSARPADREGESFLGLCQVERGDFSGAALIERAADANPQSARLALNLSILRERQGDLRGAAASASRAATLAPGQFEAWGQLGKLLCQGGKFEEAFTALKQAFAFNPRHPGIALLLAGAAIETGELATCEEALSAGESINPGAPQLLRMRAHLARKRADWDGLVGAASAWLKVEPRDEEARTALAFGLSRQGYYDRACEVYAPLAGGASPRADHLAAMGRYKLGGRRLAEAKACFDRALARDPDCAEAAFGLARYHLFHGDFNLVESCCRRALAADPRHAEAYGLLVEATGGRIADEELEKIDQLADDPSLAPEARAILLFAKGETLHRRKDAESAFAAWSAANAVKRAAAGASVYRRDEQERLTQRLIGLFSSDPLGHERYSAPEAGGAPTPIFIVGMPRSGTTLLESALAAHPDVDGAGEVPALPFILTEVLDWAEASGWTGGALPDDKREEWRGFYFNQCTKFGAAGARFVTDKQPRNFLSVGLIRRLFPDARIIHIRRNPVETGLSIFRRNFTQQWAFSTDLADIGHYYGEHARLADHWRRLLGPGLGFVQYETLAADFETEIRRLVDFCGLSWSKSCLEYYNAKRPVLTFSATQVRKAPSTEHLTSRAPYANHLGPLEEALKAAGVDLETGALLSAG